MSDPHQSPATPADKRGSIPWAEGLVMGLVGWIGTIALLKQFTVQQIGPGVRAFLVNPLALAMEIDNSTFPWAILSGILLHATFWTVLFTAWRRRSG